MNTSDTQKNRFIWLDNLKGFTIWLVVFGHSIQYFSPWEYSFWDNVFFQIIYSFHMALFMLVSGWLFFTFAQKYPWKTGIIRKAKAIMIPCILWCLISYIYHFDDHGGANIISYVSDNNWFLWALFYCCVIMMIIVRFNPSIWLGSLLVIAISILTPDAFNTLGFKIMFPAFVAGYLIHKYDILNKISKPKLTAVLSLAIYIFAMLFLVSLEQIQAWDCYYKVTDLSLLFGRWGINLLGSFVLFIIFYAFLQKKTIFAKLGENSLGIYMIQCFCYPSLLRISENVSPVLQHLYYLFLSIVIICGSLFGIFVLKKSPITKKYLLGYIDAVPSSKETTL